MATNQKPNPCALPKDDSATCDRCGKFGAMEAGNQWLCEDCFALGGACCSEFDEEPQPQPAGSETSAPQN